MKLKNILLTGFALSALTACNDFLDVDAPSKQTNESSRRRQRRERAATHLVLGTSHDGTDIKVVIVRVEIV